MIFLSILKYHLHIKPPLTTILLPLHQSLEWPPLSLQLISVLTIPPSHAAPTAGVPDPHEPPPPIPQHPQGQREPTAGLLGSSPRPLSHLPDNGRARTTSSLSERPAPIQPRAGRAAALGEPGPPWHSTVASVAAGGKLRGGREAGFSTQNLRTSHRARCIIDAQQITAG